MRRLLVLGPFLSLGLVLVVLWALVLWFALIHPRSLVREVQEDLSGAAANAAQETDALLREAESNLRTLDLVMLTRRGADHGRDPTVNLLADTLREGSRGMTDLMLANLDGRLWRIPAEQAPYADLGADSVLKELTVPGGRSIVVGAPLRLRPGARAVLPLATRLSVESGDYNAAVAFVDLDSLLRLYRGRMQRQGTAIFLARDDGIALVRVPELPGLAGSNVRAGRSDRTLPPDAPASGRFLLAEALDGRERIVSYHTLRDYPLRLFVSLEQERILAGYLAQRRAVIGFSLLVSVIAIGLMVWLTRVQLQARLREAEREATADASPMGLFRCDLQGRTVYANETYLALLEQDRDRLAWGWLDRVPEDERHEARAVWLSRVGAGEPMDRVRHLRRRDGSELIVAVRTRPMRVDGRVVAHAGTVLDITDVARQQAAARMLGDIIDLSPEFIAQTAPDGTVRYLNPAVRRRLGLSADAPLDGLALSQFHLDGSEPDLHEHILPAAERDGHWTGRWTIRTRAGQPLPVDCTMVLHRDARGQTHTISWILRDITDELAVEQERERSQAVMSAVAHSASVRMMATDTERRMLFCNRPFEQRFGIAHRAWEGRLASEVMGERYATVEPLIARALLGEDSLVELREDSADGPGQRDGAGELGSDGTANDGMANDGTGNDGTGDDGRAGPIYVELHYSPLYAENGAIIGAFGVARDITGAKQEQLRLLKASHTDPLTELLNRTGFAASIAQALARARDREELVALLYLDLDRFKPVNDEFGHPVGDALLKAVAGRLRHALRPQDLVARLGGDEFAVFLHHVARPDDAQVVADKLVQALSMPFCLGALELRIGASVGFCVDWARQVEIDALVARADQQLYHAKRAGRGHAQGSICAGDLNPLSPPPAA